MSRRAFTFLLLTSFLFVSACATEPTEDSVATGEWGGTNAGMRVSAAGASLQFKCGALGEVVGPLLLDGSRRFDVSGTYDPVLVLGGPRAARFTGSVSGTDMTLMLVVEGQQVGTYRLTFGVPASYEPCNY